MIIIQLQNYSTIYFQQTVCINVFLISLNYLFLISWKFQAF
jgi:hypothetical protein